MALSEAPPPGDAAAGAYHEGGEHHRRYSDGQEQLPLVGWEQAKPGRLGANYDRELADLRQTEADGRRSGRVPEKRPRDAGGHHGLEGHDADYQADGEQRSFDPQPRFYQHAHGHEK